MSNYYEQLLELQHAFSKGDMSTVSQTKALYAKSKHPDFAYLLCQMYCKQNHFQKALAFCEDVQAQHDTIRFRLMHSQILGSLGYSKQFRMSLARLGTEHFSNNIELASYARLCALAERPQLAFHAYSQVIKAEPNNIDAHYSAAVMARHLGKLELSYQLSLRVIELSPDAYQAYWLISQLPPMDDALWITEISKLVKQKLSIKAQVHLGYALGNLLERNNRPHEALKAITEAANLRRKHLNYDPKQDLLRLNAIEEQVAHCAAATPDPSSPSPIFILGLPRSGTTLLERILTMSPDISSVGESSELPKWMMSLLHKQMANSGTSSVIEYAHQHVIEHLAEHYFEHVGHRSSVFIDKLPMNSLNIGIILRNIPNAKIIIMRKSIEEATWSMFRMLFEDAYPYSYNYRELSNYIAQHEQLMDAWQKAFPKQILTVQYADLIQETRSLTQKVCDFIEVPWSSAMLSPERNLNASLTASSTQVRQPISQEYLNKAKIFTELIESERELCHAD